MINESSDPTKPRGGAERRREGFDKYRGTIHVRDGAISTDPAHAKYFGVPPTPLATANKWRGGNITEF